MIKHDYPYLQSRKRVLLLRDIGAIDMLNSQRVYTTWFSAWISSNMVLCGDGTLSIDVTKQSKSWWCLPAYNASRDAMPLNEAFETNS